MNNDSLLIDLKAQALNKNHTCTMSKLQEKNLKVIPLSF